MENEIWKDIIGFEGIYQISSIGRIKSLKRKRWNGYNFSDVKEKILKTYISTNGYMAIRLGLKSFTIHRLIGIAFINNPNNKPCINHKNGIKLDNQIENLEWVTYSENEIHSIRVLGKEPYKKHGANHFNSKKILCFDLNGIFIKEYPNSRIAAKELNIGFTNISSVLNGKRKTAGNFIWKFKF